MRRRCNVFQNVNGCINLFRCKPFESNVLFSTVLAVKLTSFKGSGSALLTKKPQETRHIKTNLPPVEVTVPDNIVVIGIDSSHIAAIRARLPDVELP